MGLSKAWKSDVLLEGLVPISLWECLFWQSDAGTGAALMEAGVALPARCVVEVPSSSSKIVIKEGDPEGPELTLVTFGRGGDNPIDEQDWVEIEIEIAPTGLIHARAGHTRYGWLLTSATTLRLPKLRRDHSSATRKVGSDKVRKSRVPAVGQSSPDDEREVNANAPQFDTTTPVAEPAATTPLVFVSYATPQVRLALKLAEALEEEGSRTWVAARDIEPGAEWNAAIMASVDRCDCMVVIVSDLSVQSQFVKSEVHRAFELRKRVVAVMVDECADYALIDMRLAVTQRVRWNKGNVQALLQATRQKPN